MVLFIYLRPDTPFRELRRFVRRKLRIYASDIEIAAHIVSIMGEDEISSWMVRGHQIQPEQIAHLDYKIIPRYGLDEDENPYGKHREIDDRLMAIFYHIWYIING